MTSTARLPRMSGPDHVSKSRLSHPDLENVRLELAEATRPTQRIRIAYSVGTVVPGDTVFLSAGQ